jgi:hypothetical protein
MVTLIGFFFILGNLVLLEIYVPDLVGPVRRPWRDGAVLTAIGARLGLLQFWSRPLDVFDHGQRRREAG